MPADHTDRDGFPSCASGADGDDLALIILVENRSRRTRGRYRPGEGRDGGPALAVSGRDELFANVAGRDDIDGKRQDVGDINQLR